jgi:hypothetical protein
MFSKFRNSLITLSFLFIVALSLPAFGQVTVDVKLSPAGSFQIQVPKVQGHAVVSGDKVMAQNVVVDMRTLTTGIGLRDKHTKQRLYVEHDRSVASNTPTYPTIKLIKAMGQGGKGKGIIEIMGQRKEVHGTYEIKGDQLVSEFNMNLPELGITDVKYMGVGVRDDVKVTVVLPIKSK